jgi:hypothetical protein
MVIQSEGEPLRNFFGKANPPVPIIVSIVALHAQVIPCGFIAFDILIADLAAQGEFIRQGEV